VCSGVEELGDEDVLAGQQALGQDEAVTLIRDYARNSNQRLTDVARNFVTSSTADFRLLPRRTPA
jgi:hypothetical protein